MVERTLTTGEALLLRAVRGLVLGRCRTCRPMFEAVCGGSGAEAHAMLTAFIQQLGRHGRRSIDIAAPAVARPTADEDLILAAFGCAQTEDYVGMELRLAALAAADPPLALGAAACFVAQILELSGLALPPPPAEDAVVRRPLSPASCGSWDSAPACAAGSPWA
jgi:hypothetical protein